MHPNPLLRSDAQAHYADVKPEHVAPALAAGLAAHSAAMDLIAAEGSPSFETVFLAKERADYALDKIWTVVSYLKMVVETPELRQAYAQARPLYIRHVTAVAQDRRLFDALETILGASDGLTPVQRRAVELAARGFRLSGVALPDAQREHLAQIQQELSELSTGFSNAVLDATQSWTRPIVADVELAGLASTEREILSACASARGMTGSLVTLDGPAVLAVMAYADDRGLREEVYRAQSTRASDQGPDAGRFDNGPRIVRTLELGREGSALLGFATPADLSIHVKMARSVEEAQSFLRDLARRVMPRAREELRDLKECAAKLGLSDLQAWDTAYVSERLRRARHDLDQSEIRSYLPLTGVLNGLFDLVTELFGVTLEEETDAKLWHTDARSFILRRADQPIARLYTDLFARIGKQGGAWMSSSRPLLRGDLGEQLPIARLTCNFAAPGAGRPALLTHDEMETLFHEMGHCLHHMLSEVDYPSIAGVNGIEWDAVELPSQLLENFAWEPRILRGVSSHIETGDPMPATLINKLLGSRGFMQGLAILRQIEFALFDLRIHAEGPETIEDVYRILNEVRAEVCLVPIPEWNRFAHGFSHVFAGSYSAGYFSYLWAERLSSDAYESFGNSTETAALAGDAFRKEFLAVGAGRPALESYIAFQGREPDTDALLRNRGISLGQSVS